MPPMRRASAIGYAALLSMIAGPAGAVPVTIHLRAHVPVYCNVELFPALAQADGTGVVNLGTSQELCNSPHGYRIILQHPEDLGDVVIISGADRIPVSQTGETVVWNSNEPGFEQRSLALDIGSKGAKIDRLGLRIEVKY